MEVYICHLYGQWDFFPVHEDVEQISPKQFFMDQLDELILLPCLSDGLIVD